MVVFPQKGGITMKKLFTFLLCGMLVVGTLGGCGKEDGQSQETQQEQGETGEDKPEEVEAEHEGIAGSSYTDVTVSLKEIGFPQHTISPVEGEDVVVIPAVSLEVEEGIIMRYYMSYFGLGSNYSGEIEGATFSIENGLNADPETFMELAKSYFTFCASLPYDSAEPEKAMEWVKENVEAPGEGVELIIGDAEFALRGTDQENGTYGQRTLRINKVIK